MLIREGLVPRAEVERAIALQNSEARRGVFLRLGELLVARGLLDETAVARVLGMQGRTILVCPSCLAQFNVVLYEEGRKYSATAATWACRSRARSRGSRSRTRSVPARRRPRAWGRCASATASSGSSAPT